MVRDTLGRDISACRWKHAHGAPTHHCRSGDTELSSLSCDLPLSKHSCSYSITSFPLCPLPASCTLLSSIFNTAVRAPIGDLALIVGDYSKLPGSLSEWTTFTWTVTVNGGETSGSVDALMNMNLNTSGSLQPLRFLGSTGLQSVCLMFDEPDPGKSFRSSLNNYTLSCCTILPISVIEYHLLSHYRSREGTTSTW